MPDDSPAPHSLLRARGVHKSFGTGHARVEALRGIDLEIDRGECVAVMGPSGNGKTTLLNCLSGLDEIDGGTVAFDGVDLATTSDARRTEQRARDMGFVFQSFNLIPVFDAAENVELPLLLSGRSGRGVRRAAIDMLEQVGLGHRTGHRPAELSGGEQQRVAIARALVAEPAMVWADEPTGNLDDETAETVLSLLFEIPTAGRTLVIVTHEKTIGARCRRIVEVRHGTITADRATSAAGSTADPTGDETDVTGRR